MAPKTKGYGQQLWISEADLPILEKLAESVELPKTQVLSRIVAAGVRACREAGYRMPLPLCFRITEPDAPPEPFSPTWPAGYGCREQCRSSTASGG